ncbi:MAG TPA: metal-dependent hydrolase, partial [Bacteroidota bacterium]|nr:metal-dependent hydrolase [Bacteroidota bacterium]
FIERRFGHRTLTHSLTFAAFLFLLCLIPLLAGIDLSACALLGYVSHCLLDTCTPNGVRLFYPFSSVRCVFPFDGNAPDRFRVGTGSKLDGALGILFFTACLPALYISAQGYERFIRVSQHTIESAVRDCELYGRSATVYAQMDAHDQLSGELLNGRFPVAGALNPHALVFTGHDGRLHTVGKEFESDFVAENIICLRGEPARSTVRTVEMAGMSLGGLSALEDSSVESYFFGEVVASGNLVIPGRGRYFGPVTGSGRRIRLNYARPRDLRDLNLESVLVDAGTVIVKTVCSRGAPGPPEEPSATASGGRILALTVAAGERVEFRKQRGDTIREGEILALRVIPASLEEQEALNDQKLRSARYAEASSLLDLERAVAEASLAGESDSLEYGRACELVRRGFASSASLSDPALKWARSKRTLGRLLAARRLIAGKMALEEARSALAGAELRAKAGLHALKSEFRSSITGILVDIRREPLGGREKIIFIIRTFSP